MVVVQPHRRHRLHEGGCCCPPLSGLRFCVQILGRELFIYIQILYQVRLTLSASRLRVAALDRAMSTGVVVAARSSWDLRAAAILPERWPALMLRRAVLASSSAPLAM